MPGYNEGNVFVISDFDEQLEQQLVPLTKEIKKQAQLREGLIDLHINSYGGYLYLVEHFIDLVERAKDLDIVVRTIVPSVAYSAGSMLAVTGTPGERYIARNAEHLIHYGRTGSVETTPTQAERSHEAKTRMFRKVRDHYKKYANVPNLEDEILDDGFVVTSAKAIKYGLADKYTDKLLLI